MKGELLDTSVVDQVLSTFGSKQCCVLPTFMMEEGSGSPYYGKYIGGKKDINKHVQIIVLPLCNGVHFKGYVIDLRRRQIIFIDSLYALKSGKRSVVSKLGDIFYWCRCYCFFVLRNTCATRWQQLWCVVSFWNSCVYSWRRSRLRS